MPSMDFMERGEKTSEEDKKSEGLNLHNVYSSSQTRDQQKTSQYNTKSQPATSEEAPDFEKLLAEAQNQAKNPKKSIKDPNDLL